MKTRLLILLLTASCASYAQDTTKPRRATDTSRFHQDLDTATVSARRIIISNRIDGFSFDARQLRPAAGETATDLLRRLPGVLIDEQGAPVIRGSGQIKLFIDGRPSEAYASTIAEALKLVAADNIAKVEVITHPSARYDAEGVDAVINIFTKKQLADGVAGSLNTQWANRSTQLQADLTWRKHSWVVNTYAGRYGYHYSSRSILDRSTATDYLRQTQDYDEHAHNEWAGATATYILDSLVTMNLHYQFGQAHSKTLIDYDNDFYTKDSFTGGYGTHTDNPAHRRLHTASWGLFGSSRNHKWEYDAMANVFDIRRENNYVQTGDGTTETSHNSLFNREWAFQADATRHLNPKSQLEAGLKTSIRDFANQNLLTPDTARSNEFHFRRTIVAAYVNYNLTLGDWKFRLGARYEQTHWPLHFSDTAFTPADYKNFLPNLVISRSLGQSHTVSIGYSRKLIRPWIDNLNPVVNYTDSLNIQYGNPGLQPAYSNNYELNYNYKKTIWLLTTSLFVRQTLHSIENIRLLQPGGIIASTYGNIAGNYVAGLTANLFFQPRKLTVNWTNTLSHLVFNSPGYPQRRGVEFATGVDWSYKPTATLTLSGTGYYYTGRISLQGSRTGWRNYAVMIAKDIPHTGIGLSLRVESLFAGYQHITEKTADESFTQSVQNRYVSRFVRLGLSWKFGKKDLRTPTSRSISTDN